MRAYNIQSRVFQIHVRQPDPVMVLNDELIAEIITRPQKFRDCTFICLPEFIKRLNKSRELGVVLHRFLTITRHYNWGLIFVTSDMAHIKDRHISDYIDNRRTLERDWL